MSVRATRFDALDDAALERYLTDETDRRGQRLVIAARGGAWIAETYEVGGLSGRSVVLGATGRDRRTAMLGLAEKFGADRSLARNCQGASR
jgi:hypothetical protein